MADVQMNFHSNVNGVVGNIKGDMNVNPKKIKQEIRNINMAGGKYNESVKQYSQTNMAIGHMSGGHIGENTTIAGIVENVYRPQEEFVAVNPDVAFSYYYILGYYDWEDEVFYLEGVINSEKVPQTDDELLELKNAILTKHSMSGRKPAPFKLLSRL